MIASSSDTVIEPCEAAWSESVDADVTASLESSDFKFGDGCSKFAIAAGLAAGDIIATNVISSDLTDENFISLWVKPSVSCAQGDIALLLSDSAMCASPIETLPLPALPANVWTNCIIGLTDSAHDGSLISVGLKMVTDLGAFNLLVDQITSALTQSDTTDPTIYEYDLQTLRTSTGFLYFTIISDIADLVVPTEPTLILNASREETLDETPGEIVMPTMSFRFVEDYANYYEGFWKKVTSSNVCEIKILLDEGEGPHYYFWGSRIEKACDMEELSLVHGNILRTGTFDCLSNAATLRDRKNENGQFRTIGDWLTYVDENLLTGENPLVGSPGLYKGVKITELLAAMLYTCGLNSSYSLSDVIIDAEDLKVFHDATLHTFANLYVIWSTDPAPGEHYLEELPTRWSKLPNTLALLGGICRDFQFIPSIYYDASDTRWKIKLCTRGSSPSSSLTFDSSKQSTLSTSVDTNVGTVIVNDGNGVWKGWMTGGVSHYIGTEIPADVQAELSVTLTFSTKGYGGSFPMISLVTVNGGTGFFEFANHVQYYDYRTASFVTASGADELHGAALEYLYFRLGERKRSYTRQYLSLSPTNGTSLSLFLGAKTVINDGVEDINFYLTSLSQTIFPETSTLKWVEI